MYKKDATELNILIKSVFDATGVIVWVTDGDNLIAGQGKNPKISGFGADGLAFDRDLGVTCFRIKRGAREYTGVLCGLDAVSITYAKLIARIFEKEQTSEAAGRFQRLLLGDLTKSEIEDLKKSLDNPSDFYLLCIVSKSDQMPKVSAYLRAMAEASDLLIPVDSEHLAYLKSAREDGDYKSVNEFAHILYENMYEELGLRIKIGVGGESSRLESAPALYSQAIYALSSGGLIDSSNNIYFYKDYLIAKLLEEVPSARLKEYTQIILGETAASIFSDAELLSTAEAFLNKSLNISETSRILYLHRNTLLYRLDKIERLCGLDIRKFADAAAFRILLIVHRILNK